MPEAVHGSGTMTTTMPGSNLREFCERCERETRHAVKIELRTENVDAAGCSREPYRVSRCLVCEDTQARRMNDA